MNVENITFERLNLTPRVKGIFKVNGVTIDDILADKYTLDNFYYLKYLGKDSIRNIKESFLSIGYQFKDEIKYL